MRAFLMIDIFTWFIRLFKLKYSTAKKGPGSIITGKAEQGYKS